MTDQNRLSQVALHFIPHIGHYLIKQLVSYCGSAEAVFNTPKNKLLKVPGVGAVSAESIVKHKPLKEAEMEFERALKDNVNILLYTDADYPKRLKHINDAPSILYYKGNTSLNAKKIVSIVGTRKATEYGKSVVDVMVKELVRHEPLIVSGLAYGIDIQAHKASLKNGLPTIGVMAGGMNMIYPASHRGTADKMTDNGGLLTEQRFDSKPDAPKFPARNRIIAGMADVIIVVEAASRGGALITAEIANGYNKDVFAVPGPIHHEFSAGCNNLIKSNKAHLLTSLSDIEYIMNWSTEEKEDPTQKINHLLSQLVGDEKLVTTQLANISDPMPIDKLSWTTQLSVNQLASILLQLEFKGLVKTLPGKRYTINKI